MFPSDRSDQSEPHHGIQEFLNYLSQFSKQIEGSNVQISFTINNNPGGDDNERKNAVLSRSVSSSSSSQPSPKRHRTQMHTPGDVDGGLMCDKLVSLQVAAETTTQPTVRTTDEKAKDVEVDELKQQVDEPKNMIDTLKQMKCGNHMNIMRDGIINLDSDADANVDITDAPSSPPLIVARHNTRQFTITPIILPYTIRPATENYPYPKMCVEDQYIVIPSIILHALANNPNILLPLASFQACLFDPIHALNGKSFHLSCEPIDGFTCITRVTLSVVCTRIRSALNRLYPKACIHGFGVNDRLKKMALKLDKGPVDVLKSIVRDSLAVWNPIRMLVTHLEGVTIQYSRCTTHDAQETLRQHVIHGYSWMYDIVDMAVVYGLYLWDSRWVSNDEWRALVQHMNILTTKIFPEAYDSFLKLDSGSRSGLAEDDCDTIRYFKLLFGIISCCFIHHYRPVKDNTHIPYRNLRYTNTYEHSVPEPVFKTAMASSTALFKQCVVEYMNRPAAFPQFSPMLNLIWGVTRDEYDCIMSEVDRLCTSHITPVPPSLTKNKNPDDTVNVCWTSRAPLYFGELISPAIDLTDRIIHAPPHNDSVYKKIATIYRKRSTS